MRSPGFFSAAGLLASAVVLLVVGGITWLSGGILFSPGPLNAMSASGQVIGGVNSHAALANNCGACHAAPWEQDHMGQRCLACHRDVAEQLAGGSGLHAVLSATDNCRACHTEHRGPTAVLTAFHGNESNEASHERTGFALAQHVKQTDGSPFQCETCHPKGYAQFEQTVCADCHTRIDAAFMPQHMADYGSNCLGCHNGSDHLAKFNHAGTRLPLDGKHAALACRACHAGRTRLAGLPVTCNGCHQAADPHASRLGQECQPCHNTASWTDARFDHGTTQFALAGMHVQVPCLQCHADRTFAAVGTACATCHAKDDAHQGKLGADCGACHDASGWSKVTFDHGRTKFPLNGKHAGLPCSNCHQDRVFAGTNATCAACHAKDDAHHGTMGSDCGACHNPEGWSKATFDHGQTGFVLVGRHSGLSCLQCHTDRTYKGAQPACAACHAKDDLHKGKLGAACARCHTATGWLPSTFDHKASAFPLAGKHAQVLCLKCHADRTFTGAGKLCVSCHAQADAHRGNLGQQCERCHTPAGWVPASFDHNTTHFPLTGRHTQVGCMNCHADATFSGANPACNACHAKNDAHGGQFGTDCGFCHNTTSWKGASFDHNRFGFQLTGRHASVPCARCHKSDFKGTSTACSSCHGLPGGHMNILDAGCELCHSPDAWKPASFNHSFDIHHGGAGSCSTCHPNGYRSHSCASCHDGNPEEDGD